jgi:hypothetical protein
MKRNYLITALVGLFTVVAICSCNKDEDENNAGNSVISNNTITAVVENGVNYNGKIDIVKAEILSGTGASGITLASASYGNGGFTLNLPANVDAQYLSDADELLPPGLTISNPNVKACVVGLNAYKSGSQTRTGFFYTEIEGWEGEELIYADGNVNVTGSHSAADGEISDFNLHLRKGWNMMYFKGDNISTQVPAGAKWYLLDFSQSFDENSGNQNNTGRGYAPASVLDKEIVFNRNGTWNFASSMISNSQGSYTDVRINAEVTSIAYDKGDPTCTYRKTGDNTAQYTLEFWHKAYVPYYGSYSYGYNYYSLSLTFTSASAGTYTGTRSNGDTSEKREGTFSIKSK